MIITLSRQIGAGGSEVARHLVAVLGYECVDRDLIHQEAALSGIPEPTLHHLDESAPSFWERMAFMDRSARYFRALERILRDLAERDRVILVGRGGNFFLREHPRAYHVRLVAEAPDRIRRIMAARWLNEEPARRVLEETDRKREAFVRHLFGADGADPLGYHAVYNTSRVAPEEASALIADAVHRREEKKAT